MGPSFFPLPPRLEPVQEKRSRIYIHLSVDPMINRRSLRSRGSSRERELQEALRPREEPHASADDAMGTDASAPPAVVIVPDVQTVKVLLEQIEVQSVNIEVEFRYVEFSSDEKEARPPRDRRHQGQAPGLGSEGRG